MNHPAKRADELANRAARAEEQLQVARGALSAAEAARVKAQRLATHREEMEKATPGLHSVAARIT